MNSGTMLRMVSTLKATIQRRCAIAHFSMRV